MLSVGNSVVYDSRAPNAGFLIPVAFFKAIDHANNATLDNMNSQLFITASSRNLEHFHFYGTAFIDEFAMHRITENDEFNFLSFKAGVSSTMLKDFRMVAEYTWSNCLAFMHYVPTTTFESNQYNLGHYLEDNAKERCWNNTFSDEVDAGENFHERNCRSLKRHSVTTAKLSLPHSIPLCGNQRGSASLPPTRSLTTFMHAWDLSGGMCPVIRRTWIGGRRRCITGRPGRSTLD